jgi:hypothetical protein
MQLLQSFRDQRNIAGTDLEQTIAAERTSLAALQVLRLRIGYRTKEIVGAIEDARVRFAECFRYHATHNR